MNKESIIPERFNNIIESAKHIKNKEFSQIKPLPQPKAIDEQINQIISLLSKEKCTVNEQNNSVCKNTSVIDLVDSCCNSTDNNLQKIINSIGTASNDSSASTLFGNLSYIKSLNSLELNNLDLISSRLSNLENNLTNLTNLYISGSSSFHNEIDKLNSKFNSIENTINNIENIIISGNSNTVPSDTNISQQLIIINQKLDNLLNSCCNDECPIEISQIKNMFKNIGKLIIATNQDGYRKNFGYDYDHSYSPIPMNSSCANGGMNGDINFTNYYKDIITGIMNNFS